MNQSTTDLLNLSLLSASLSSCACDGLDLLLTQSKEGGNASLSHFFPRIIQKIHFNLRNFCLNIASGSRDCN